MPQISGQQKKTARKPKKVIRLENQKEPVRAEKEAIDPDALIFALDIGTRTVVGIAGIPEEDRFKVLAAEIVEHKNRAMLDGQIHDIRQVAEAAKEVKDRLEKSLGLTLTKVAIAAAGRVLKTCEVKVERDIEQGREIDQELISSIEMEGIQRAQMMLDEEVLKEEKTQFYCVGYSVIGYFLNGYVISSLLGHKGKRVGADILATFLPHIVVDSLYTVMSRIGLEVVSLTLEPIAAINVTIPKDLRLLNLALVDIGAGTSDIAITKDGSVVAYAMVPVAGDEVTEKVAQQYLVDFNTAEKIKISLTGGKDTISFVDILGKKHTVRSPEVTEVVRPSVELLAATVSQKIVEYNHKAPNAVFLIGGGSQIPGLTEMIAAQLGLPNDRVVVRGRDVLRDIKWKGKKLSGPEAITPFGIAATAHMQRGQDFLSVTLNGKKIRLFNSRKLTIADALILVGFNPDQLIGRTGKSISFALNGVKRTLRGEHGKPAEIKVNGVMGGLDTVLKPGDSIRVIPAENGRNARATVSDIVPVWDRRRILFNGAGMDVGTVVYSNETVVDGSYEIGEGDILHVNEIATVGDLLQLAEIDRSALDILVNGAPVDDGYGLQNGDQVAYGPKAARPESKKDGPEGNAAKDGFAEGPTAQPSESPAREGGAIREVPPDSMAITVNGEEIFIPDSQKQYIFVDIFNYIRFDLTKPQGNIVLRLNGKQAAFTDRIRAGDAIEIYWQK